MEKKTLDVLVVEDTPIHQEAARAMLTDYNVTVVGTFDEASDLITGGSRYSPNRDNKRVFDAVLTDMFYSQGRGDCMADKSAASQEMPFGYAVAMMALKEGTPYVGILSDVSHHENPIGYTLDMFMDGNKAEVMRFGDSRVVIAGCIEPAYKTPSGKIGALEEVGELKEIEEGIEHLVVPEGSQDVKNYRALLEVLTDGFKMGKRK